MLWGQGALIAKNATDAGLFNFVGSLIWVRVLNFSSCLKIVA